MARPRPSSRPPRGRLAGRGYTRVTPRSRAVRIRPGRWSRSWRGSWRAPAGGPWPWPRPRPHRRSPRTWSSCGEASEPHPRRTLPPWRLLFGAALGRRGSLAPRRRPRSWPVPHWRMPSTCAYSACAAWRPRRVPRAQPRSPACASCVAAWVATSAVTGASARSVAAGHRRGLAGGRRFLAELGPQHLLELGRNLAPLGAGSGRRSPGGCSVVTSATRLATRRGGCTAPAPRAALSLADIR